MKPLVQQSYARCIVTLRPLLTIGRSVRDLIFQTTIMLLVFFGEIAVNASMQLLTRQVAVCDECQADSPSSTTWFRFWKTFVGCRHLCNLTPEETLLSKWFETVVPRWQVFTLLQTMVVFKYVVATKIILFPIPGWSLLVHVPLLTALKHSYQEVIVAFTALTFWSRLLLDSFEYTFPSVGHVQWVCSSVWTTGPFSRTLT